MKYKIIKIKTYSFDELDENAKENVKRKTLFFFKDMVNKDTLFLRDGTFFDKESLNFIGLKDFEIYNINLMEKKQNV